GPNAGDLRRGDRGTDPGAADQDAALRLSVLEGRADLDRFVRVVDPDGVGVGAEVDDLVAVCAQRLEDLLAEPDAPVVEGDGDVHVAARTRFSLILGS